MLTTSTEAHAQSAINTACTGLAPCAWALSVSKTILLLSETASYVLSCFQSLYTFIAVILLSCIFRCRLGVNGHAVHLRAFLLQAIFKRCDDLMHVAHWQRIGQRAVAGEIDMVADAQHCELMHIDDLRELRRGGAQGVLNALIVEHDFFGLLDSCRLALNMGEHGVNFRRFMQDFFFKRRDEAMHLDERQALIELDVLSHAQPSMMRLHAELMHEDVVARSYSALAIKDVPSAGVAGAGVNHHVCAWKCAIDGFRGGAHDFAD